MTGAASFSQVLLVGSVSKTIVSLIDLICTIAAAFVLRMFQQATNHRESCGELVTSQLFCAPHLSPLCIETNFGRVVSSLCELPYVTHSTRAVSPRPIS